MTITGGGNDIWNQSDNFYFFYTTVEGHVWDAKVRVHDLQGPDGWTKCELMVRVPDASGLPQGPDPFIAAMTTRSAGQNQVAPQWRATRGGNADWNAFNQSVAPSYPNTWLRLTRQGSVITMWYGTDGVNWTKYADIDTASTQWGFGQAFPSRVLVGVAVTAHNDGDPNGGVATISDLSVTVSPQAPNLQVLTDLQNRTVYSHTAVTLSFVVTNAAVANGSLGVGDYQWYKNGQPIPNANGPVYTFVVAPEDNNAQFMCRAALGTASIESATATLTVRPSVGVTGYGTFGVGGWGAGVLAPFESLTDGVFLPERTRWDLNTVWWDGNRPESATNYIVIDLGWPTTITGFTIQRDHNDVYYVDYWDGSQWRTAWRVPPYMDWWGMKTESTSLAAPITTSRLRVWADYYVDRYFSVSELQVEGASLPQEPPVLTVVRQGGNVVISWSPAGGRLESSPVLGPGATWTTETTDNPAVIPIRGTAKYFRVVR